MAFEYLDRFSIFCDCSNSLFNSINPLYFSWACRISLCSLQSFKISQVWQRTWYILQMECVIFPLHISPLLFISATIFFFNWYKEEILGKISIKVTNTFRKLVAMICIASNHVNYSQNCMFMYFKKIWDGVGKFTQWLRDFTLLHIYIQTKIFIIIK